MNESQQLRESMWDLVYGLLSPEESEALIVRIKSDPEAARLYSEVRLQADLVGQAARVEDSSVVVTPDGTAKPVPSKRSATVDSHRGGAWLAGIAMTALAALLMVGFFWPRPDVQQLAGSFVSIDVTGQQSFPAGLTNQVAVRTSRATYGDEPNEGTSNAIELRLLDRAGKERFRKSVQTNDIGQAQIEIPGAAIEPGVRIEIAAAEMTSDRDAMGAAGNKMKEQSSVAAELPVQPEPQMAYFLLAEPKGEAEKQVPFSVWSFSAFSAKPASAETSQAALETVDGLVRADSAANSQDGQVNGTLQFAAGEKEEARSLALRDKKDSATTKGPDDRLEIAAGQPITMDIPLQLVGKPIDVAAVCRGVTVANTTVETLGRSEGGQNKGAQLTGGQVSLTIPPEADGLIEVSWFDRSTSESEPVQRDFVYRQPIRRIQIELPELQERFAPGQEVALTLRCTDESGNPAADTRLGIRVWNEQLIQESGEQPVLLADAARGGSTDALQEAARHGQQAQMAERGIAEVDRLSNRYAVPPVDHKRLADNAQPAAVTSVAMGESIELASNREQVKSEIRAAYARGEAERQRAIQIIGGAAMFGGIAVLLLLGMLALLRTTVGLRTMSPALVAALASVLVGLVWVGWMPQPKNLQIAMAPAPAAPASQLAADTLESSLERESVVPTAVPALVGGEALTAGSRLNDKTAAAVVPAAEKPKGEPAATVTLRQNAAAPKVSPVPGSAPQEASNLRSLELQREEQKVELADKRTAGGFGAAAGKSAARVAIANGPAAKARPLPVPQLSADASANERLRRPSSGAATAPPGAAGAAAAKSEVVAAPSSLYFNPQLMTDADGRATVRFVMPQAASEYRLLIDALGQGRIGSRQQLIVCGSPEAAK